MMAAGIGRLIDFVRYSGYGLFDMETCRYIVDTSSLQGYDSYNYETLSDCFSILYKILEIHRIAGALSPNDYNRLARRLIYSNHSNTFLKDWVGELFFRLDLA